MDPISESLTEASLRFKRVAGEILEAYEARRPASTDQVTPAQLAEAIEQFMVVAINLDKDQGETGPIYKDDVNQLGDYGITLLADLATWATQLGFENLHQELETVALAVAGWVVRHEGELRTLEPIVNALANLANQTHDPQKLESLADFMGRILHACSDLIKQDLEKANPGRPWRVLHLNRGIVATRSHNPAVMESVFNELVQTLPEEAPQFFSEGMQQMEALNYPTHVRQVMVRYFDRWSRMTMH
ncbi:MAG: hypothetical protein BMS9Abin22_059 [Gammaproteobacteria bacterium]|nr:MAG: hypothetical protein BMS9Abin22_059 [Gammaproteobacteria bacterium]